MDREEQDIFNLTVIAEDHGIPQHSSSQMLCVHVIDVNDEVPWFEESQYEAQISENQPPGTSVLTVSASDLDQGEVSFISMLFKLIYSEVKQVMNMLKYNHGTSDYRVCSYM